MTSETPAVSAGGKPKASRKTGMVTKAPLNPTIVPRIPETTPIANRIATS